jgi:hypothetical protein
MLKWTVVLLVLLASGRGGVVDAGVISVTNYFSPTSSDTVLQCPSALAAPTAYINTGVCSPTSFVAWNKYTSDGVTTATLWACTASDCSSCTVSQVFTLGVCAAVNTTGMAFTQATLITALASLPAHDAVVYPVIETFTDRACTTLYGLQAVGNGCYMQRSGTVLVSRQAQAGCGTQKATDGSPLVVFYLFSDTACAVPTTQISVSFFEDTCTISGSSNIQVLCSDASSRTARSAMLAAVLLMFVVWCGL